jgi:hypothetical protein
MLPGYLLSNSAVREMYARLPGTAEQSPMETEQQESEEQPEQEQEQETKGQEEEQEPESQGEEEEQTTTPFETPLHSAMPPLTTIRKVEERAPTKSSPLMPPRPAHVPSKTSGIPTVWPKRETGKASTSQAGHGRRAEATEHACDEPHFPGKPIRILRLYGTSTTTMPMRGKSGKASSSSLARQYGEGITEHIYDDPCIPGKKIRVLRLY